MVFCFFTVQRIKLITYRNKGIDQTLRSAVLGISIDKLSRVDNKGNQRKKEGKLMLKGKNKPEINPDTGNDDMDGGAIGDALNSDNSFSDKGLNNDRLTREAVKKANSHQ
jgi:hypothetical protein